jgi:hypothetical protein
MYSKPLKNTATLALLIAIVPVAVECNESENNSRHGDVKVAKTGVATAGGKNDNAKHSGWWCDEHGVPEGLCGQCDAKLAAQFKKKGDWCTEHDRPDSQCFIHHPELKARFAAMYRAKYGKEPPPMEDESRKDQKN